MAGGIMLLAAMILVLPLDEVVPIHGLVQLVSDTSRVFMLLQDVVRPICVSFLVGAPLGGLLGYLLLSRIDQPTWLLGMIAIFLLYVVFKPKRLPEIRLRPRGFFCLGVISSCVGCLIGASGPLLTPFFIRTDLRKESMVATKAACQIAMHGTKIPIFLALQFDYGAYALWIAGMIAAVILGSKIGTLLLHRISSERFMILAKTAMVIIAIRLIYKVTPICWPLESSTWIAARPLQNTIEQIALSPEAQWASRDGEAPRLPIATASIQPSHALPEPARDSTEAAWERVKASVHPSDLMAFRLSHPNSRFSLAARIRYRQLKRQQIRRIQNHLRTLGFDPGRADGMFGPRTQSALRRYQQAHGLPVSGRQDPATMDALRLETHKVK